MNLGKVGNSPRRILQGRERIYAHGEDLVWGYAWRENTVCFLRRLKDFVWRIQKLTVMASTKDAGKIERARS